jgi:thiamine kinase-like enzyme
MGSQNFLHMDAHFGNILTDGKQLYYSDFELSLYGKFTLSNIEGHFIKDNANCDYASGNINLIHIVLINYLGKNDWNTTLSKFTEWAVGS